MTENYDISQIWHVGYDDPPAYYPWPRYKGALHQESHATVKMYICQESFIYDWLQVARTLFLSYAFVDNYLFGVANSDFGPKVEYNPVILQKHM